MQHPDTPQACSSDQAYSAWTSLSPSQDALGTNLEPRLSVCSQEITCSRGFHMVRVLQQDFYQAAQPQLLMRCMQLKKDPCIRQPDSRICINFGRRARFATVALILAIRTRLPGVPWRIICFATAWAVINTPVTLISCILLTSDAA